MALWWVVIVPPIRGYRLLTLVIEERRVPVVTDPRRGRLRRSQNGPLIDFDPESIHFAKQTGRIGVSYQYAKNASSQC